MIDIEELDGGFRAVDAAKNEVTVEIDDWEPGGKELDIGYDVDETITGSGTAIRLPNGGFAVESSELDDPRMINMNEQVRLENGSHFFRHGADINVYVRIERVVALVAVNSKQHNLIEFPTRAQFTIGLKQYNNRPDDEIRILPSIEGAAIAISACASRHTTETPDRSFPSERPFLPHVVVDDDVEATDSERDFYDNSLLFRIPESLGYLFPIGPLAFYLGAPVVVEDRRTPVLELGAEVYEFSSGSGFSEEVASLLRRVFYLDCLVRESGPRRLGIREVELLEMTSLDAERLYHSSMLERIRAYLAVPFESISPDLPKWPLATFVDPTLENLPMLSYLLERLSMVCPPRASPVDGAILIERSLSDFYRSTAVSQTPDRPIEIATPSGTEAQIQGWIADGSPINGFKCLPEAIENRRFYLTPTSDPISVRVIVNIDDVDVEHPQVVEIYRDRAEDLDIELDVLHHSTTDELARAFESQTDFIHYIGHCDPAGFRCVDGIISAEELSQCRARTFFLNACGSYNEGVELVRKGGVAGAVTYGDVIDAEAVKVGVNFARLYMLGYTIQRSLHHASRLAIVNKQYATVGEGTHVLTQGDSIQPCVMEISSRSDDMYDVAQNIAPVNLPGSVFLGYANSEPNLMGNRMVTQLSHSTLKKLIPSSGDPLIFDDKFYWPEELLEEHF